MKNNLYKQFFNSSTLAIAFIEIISGKFIETNQTFRDMISFNTKELASLNFWNLILEKDKSKIIEGLSKTKLITKKEKQISIKINCFVLKEEELLCVQIEENTEQNEHEIIHQDNKLLLEYIAIENSLDKILNKIVKLAEKRNKYSMCSILLLDKEKKHLFTKCAPSLPSFYTKAISGIKIGEKVGSCGSATYKKQRVVVDNIDTHENWKDYLVLTNKANLHSCWSEPIISSTNEILGSFAVYTKTHKYPSDFEIRLIQTYSNLVSKAIEKDTNTKEIIEREMEIKQLFDNNQIGLMYISSERILLKANQKLAEIFAYKDAEEMIGLKLSELHLSKETYDLFGEKYFDTLKNEEKVDIEYQVRKKDGSIIWCEISGKPSEEKASSKGTMWMIKDISLRKEYELQLKNSELLNKNILSTIPDLLWLKDKNGIYLTCNPEFEKCFGKKRDEIIGKTDYDITSKESAISFRGKDKEAIISGKAIMNEEWLTHITNNNKILVETSKKVMKDQDGNIIGVLGIGHNITKIKQKEEELKELNIKASEISNSQQALLSLFDKGDAILFKWRNDKKRSIEYISLSVLKLFGYSREEFLSEEINYSSCIHKNDLKNVKEELLSVLRNNLDYFKHKPYRIVTKNGDEKWVLDNIVTLKNEKNEIISFISYIIDISEQIKNQELVFHQSKIASMGEMLVNISHQWRQPLSAISTLATGSSLKKEIEILEDTEFHENMDLINKNAQYLSKTIDDFRNFFASDMNIKKETNLKNSFTSIYSLIKDSFKSSNIKIIFNLQDTSLIINESIFIQAMINILNNARDAFTQNNNIDKYVFVDLLKNENEYLLTIKDNAGGIEESIKDKIFEPYFTTKHKSQGTGIGLYMTNQIITKQIHGQILVKNVNYVYEDKKFCGASFEIKIPI